MPKSFDPLALFSSSSLSSAGSGALTFSQCFCNEGWGGGSLVGVWYPHSTSPISNVSASFHCEPPHSGKNEGSVKVSGFDQECSLLGSNSWQTHKHKRLHEHTIKNSDLEFQTKACCLCARTFNFEYSTFRAHCLKTHCPCLSDCLNKGNEAPSD